jgi:hypothetical protein
VKWSISLLLIGLCAEAVHAQANPDPAVSHPVVCKKSGDTGPAGNCVALDPHNPEHRKLLDKMNQTPPDIRSAPPVLVVPPPPLPDLGSFFKLPEPPPPPSYDLGVRDSQVPAKPQTKSPFNTLPDTGSKPSERFQPGQAPSGSGALSGIAQAMNEANRKRQQRRLQGAQARLQAANAELSKRMMGLSPQEQQKIWDRMCLSEGDSIELMGQERTCEIGTDGMLHAPGYNPPAAAPASSNEKVISYISAEPGSNVILFRGSQGLHEGFASGDDDSFSKCGLVAGDKVTVTEKTLTKGECVLKGQFYAPQ